MSLPGGLCNRTLDTIVERAGLAEVTSDDGGPFRTLVSVMGPDPVGAVRVFTGDPDANQVAKAVYVGITVPQIGLDSHMVFAFADESAPIPHFTLDSVSAHGYFAFHLDLIQRADLGTHLTYLDWAHTPLTATFEEVQQREGLSKAAIGPRQASVMSPWMCVARATEEAFAGIEDAVAAYLGHWFSLVEAPVPAEVTADLADTDLAARDERNRSILFSPDVDKVWAQISQLLGPEVTEGIRAQLLSNEVKA
ncbi:hypothetical protein E8D34_07080 [Nocardioides sp. GY 10113]|uniref:hypothetical protein n=1 Tax=Nocardioides sp. GY 10113 TaxID=2569761 RepID=UPI0010A760E5|nr:hypothetical protein [Nocardioides sp. GY 10113]TIC88044.1 hypothetical protein E8D34_07080 [Nocardioides sp. GY 10113]